MLTIVVPAYGQPGNQYAQFVPRWWLAVAAMSPGVSEVVVAHSTPEPLGLIAQAPAGISVKGVEIAGSHLSDYLNAGCEAATQPWVSCIGVDDCYRMHAMRDLEQADKAGADIMVFSHQERGGHVWRCFWNPKVLRHANTLTGTSPFRRDLWCRIGGFPRLGWSDWGFWLKAAAADAVAFQSDEIGVDFDMGYGHETWSGQSLPDHVRLARDAEIDAFSKELDLCGSASTP